MRSDLFEFVFVDAKPPEQLENMSVVVETLRVNGNSCGKSYGNNVPGAGSVYNSFKLFARFFCDVSHFGVGFSKKYLLQLKNERRKKNQKPQQKQGVLLAISS